MRHTPWVTSIERPRDLTAEWLTAALGAGTVESFSTERIGTGQMSECYRVVLTYADGADGPASVVLKVAATDPASRQTGLALGLYEREVRFYTDIAPGVGGPVAPCYSSGFDSETGVFHLLLGDAAPAVVGDEIRGATVEQAILAMAELGRLHAPLLGRTSMSNVEWLNRESPINQALIGHLYAGFVDRYGDDIAAAHREVCERLVASFDAYLAQEAAADRVQGLVHGDYRLDNMLFGQPGADRPLTVVDWQTVTWGSAMTDVAYFLGCALADGVRRDHYDALLRAYHDALGPDATLSLDDVREGVRRAAFFGVTMAIVSPMLVERTSRGDEMFMTMLRRHAQHVLDTDALATLPGAAAPEPLQPSAEDERAHPPGAEPLWSESWYADFADEGQGIGGWFRLGLIPNQRTAWVNALLCGPDMPTVAVNDFQVALPDDPAAVRSDVVELSHAATDPLQTYHVSLRGRGQAYDDPSALLRGQSGRPVELSMDLHWTTAGTPYLYRLTPRYEIPCAVSGTVTFDGNTIDVHEVPGQRDHSWGVRDWWGMDWVWSALHLHDGTHLHAVDIRIPGSPRFGVGYIQRAGSLTELQTVTAREGFGNNDLPATTELMLSPGDVTATVQIKGHAPVLLTATDGRMSHFPRAWAAVTTADGRSGVGWLEWNRNLR
ncbi:phosphotransferase [Mycobacteriaceae bacterium 1482268.1]|nr:phosphotransferase [Mycobacteriaceae bacterium 1482268.1]